MNTVVIRPVARQDLEDIFVWIGADNLEAAERFLHEAEDTFALLAAHPLLGRQRRFRAGDLRGIRSFPVLRFPNYLVFYQTAGTTVEITRVIHGSRDLPTVFL